MKTAFFPFTYLTHPIFIALKTLFGAFTLYQPLADTVPESLKKWEADHQLHLCFPAIGNESQLHRALRAYRQWAENHAPTQREFLRFQDAQASLSNDAHIFRIRDEIRDRMRGTESDPGTEPLLAARLFLALAQEYDSRHMEIIDDWAQLQKMESSLFDTLQGDVPLMTEEDSRMPTGIGAPASIVIAKRLRAWSRLMLEDDLPPVIFVTTSREAFEIIADDTPSVDLLPGFDAASFPLPPNQETPVASRRLMSYLNAVAASEWSSENTDRFKISKDQSTPRIKLTLGIVPDTPAGTVFSRYSGHASLSPKQRDDCRHTFLALVEW